MFIDFEKAFDSRVQPKHFRSRGPSENVRVFPACWPWICHRNELTYRDWENVIQELGKAFIERALALILGPL